MQILPSDLAEIRRHPLLVKVLKSLKEVSCEILTVDSRTFTTDQPNALCDLFGDKAVGTSEHETAINVAATRLATLFTTLKEFPTVRYKVGKQTNERDPAGAAARSLVAQTVASRVHALLAEGQQRSAGPTVSMRLA